MAIDPWLPSGFQLSATCVCRRAIFEGDGWQVYELASGGRALVARMALVRRWQADGLLEHIAPTSVNFAGEDLAAIESAPGQSLGPVTEGQVPASRAEAMSFASSLKATRAIQKSVPLHDAIYVERISRLLPAYSLAPPIADDVLFGAWLSGGVRVSTNSRRRLLSLLRGISEEDLVLLLKQAGLPTPELVEIGAASVSGGHPEVTAKAESPASKSPERPKSFALPGREVLERFFQEHVIDLIQNEARYAALGIRFPSPVALYGPPGSGKTYAVERLVDYLGWPSFSIDSGSIGSPYIHETGKKIAKVFDDAIKASPAVVIIDEMESFLSDRQGAGGAGLHHVEEVAEFLRRIPEVVENRVFLVGMTNRIDMIDPAILRRGRFDHVLEVGMPGEEEVHSMLRSVLSKMPGGDLVESRLLARRLVGRPLSDAAFVVREGARLAAKSGKDRIDSESLLAALDSSPARADQEPSRPSIGFRRS